ncbi:MAG: toll/interleukin-1 receptor domain-containing protein [Bryobacteraceae bacterium]
MSVPVARRQFDAFLSYAHTDKVFAEALFRWLTEVAGLNIWYDARDMDGGALIGTGLQKAIEQCRGILSLASSDAIQRGWFQDELNVARDERAQSPDFRVILLRIADAKVGELVRPLSWIDVPSTDLTADVAAAILRAFYPGDRRPDPGRSRDVYVSASWQSGDNTSAQAVCRELVTAGFRLIGDAKDQKGFRDNRLQSIIGSCGAFVAVIPYRGDEKACAAEGPYRYFLRELDLAIAAGMPVIVIADSRVHRSDGDDKTWLRMDTGASACPAEVGGAIQNLWNVWQEPARPHYIFFATDLSAPTARRSGDLRDLIERVTGMPTVVGDEIQEAPLQVSIARSLKEAFLVIADITGSPEPTFNLDVCIEAGIARAVDGNLVLMAAGNPRRPPFMLRDLQMPTYQNAVEQLGLIHRIVKPYRRRVLNAEL